MFAEYAESYGINMVCNWPIGSEHKVSIDVTDDRETSLVLGLAQKVASVQLFVAKQ